MCSAVVSQQRDSLVNDERDGTDGANQCVDGKRNHADDEFGRERREPFLDYAAIKNQTGRDSGKKQSERNYAPGKS